MRFLKDFSSIAMSISLAAFINGCGQKEFKGSAPRATIAKDQDAKSEVVPEPIPSPEPNPIVDQEVSTLIPTHEEEVPIVEQEPQYIMGSFSASEIKHDEFSFTLDGKSASTTFKLTDITATKSEPFKQNTRQLITDTFKQGTAGTAMSQSFEQRGKKGLVDILVVIDNSISMDQEQQNLSTKLSALLTSIKGSNWQIGIITTTVQANDACKMTVIRSTDANAEAKFKAAATPGLNGAANEAGIKQAVIGLRCKEKPWLRDDATTAVLIVSDADNCTSDGKDCGANAWAKESYLIDYVEKNLKKTVWKDAGFYGIFSRPSAVCKTAESTGIQYQRLMNYKNANGAAHKNAGDICASNYTSILNEISGDISLLLSNQFELSTAPDANPVKLSVGGVVVPSANYSIKGKTITFKEGKQPADGTILKVDYHVGETARFQKVTLDNDPAPETVAIDIDGKDLAANAYTLSGRVITFKTQPADRSIVNVDYRVKGPMVNVFKLTQAPLANTLKVTVNGIVTKDATFDASKNQIVFNPVPIDGANIVASYTYKVGPKLLYSVASATGSTAHKIYDGVTEIPFSKNGDTYTINASNHVAGKILTLKYDVPDNTSRTFDLPFLPVENSAKFDKATSSCKAGSGIAISGKRISVSCSIVNETEFVLAYDYLEKHNSFTIEVPNPEVGTWEVLVDGVSLEDYVREDKTIRIDFDKYLKLESKIDIRYRLPEE